MATTHTSNFGSFGNRLHAIADRNGYVRFDPRHVTRIKAWLADSSYGASDDEVEDAVQAQFRGVASGASILVAMAEASVEEWQGRRS
jgi:hypothetical protein